MDVMWSCEWNNLKTEKQEIVNFLETTSIEKPLSVKEAFRGGRTNAFKLQYEVKADEKIRHIDVTSLYPTVNKHDAYPIGHPEVILSDFKDIKEYFGIVKCTVKAPSNEMFPILPGSYNGKLVFALCRKCAEQKTQAYCEHHGSVSERHLVYPWAP